MTTLELLKETARIRKAALDAFKLAADKDFKAQIDLTGMLYIAYAHMNLVGQYSNALQAVWVYQIDSGLKLTAIEDM